MTEDRIHPSSARELSMLVQLHGSRRLKAEIDRIEARLAAENAEAGIKPIRCNWCAGTHPQPAQNALEARNCPERRATVNGQPVVFRDGGWRREG